MSLILSWIRRPGPRRDEAAAIIRAFVSTLSRLDAGVSASEGGDRLPPEETP